MNAYPLTLRVLAVGIIGVSLIHVLFGVSSETFLGSSISETSLVDANLDSQNRFYGAAFSLFSVVWWIGSTDLERYKLLLTASFIVFFIAGVSRLFSLVFFGLPTNPVIMLLVIELILPPFLYVGLRRTVT